MAAIDASVAAALARVELVLDAVPRALVIVDRQARVVVWNRGAEALYGYLSADALGVDALDLITPPSLHPAARRLLARVLDGESWSGSIRAMHRDGRQRTTFMLLAPLHDEGGAVVGAIGSSDATLGELTRLEHAASELADRLMLALGAGRLGTWRWELTSETVTWDAAMERLFGLAPDGFDGAIATWMSRLHPGDVGAFSKALQQAQSDHAPFTLEHRALWPDGSLRWIEAHGIVTLDDQGVVTGLIGCASDISERKALEADAQRRVVHAEQSAQRERRQRERAEFLAALDDLAVDAADHTELLARVVAMAVPRLGDWCLLHFRPEPHGPIVTDVAHRDPQRVAWARAIQQSHPMDPDAEHGAPLVMRTGQTEFFAEIDPAMLDEVIARNRRMDPDEMRALAELLGLTSVITVPLRTTRGVIGALQLINAESGRHYDDDDVSLAEAAAGRIAAAMDNAWLTEQQEAISATLQAALLPRELPEIPGVDIAVRYWAAGAVSEVGGDFYDVFPIGPRRWAVVIGDVCGTGAGAAAVTSVARHTIRAAATHGIEHIEVLAWVNQAILASGTGLFCTIVYSTLEQLDDGAWRYISVAGGHPLPLVAAPEQPTMTLGRHGTLIGALRDVSVTVAETVLAPGTTLVLHTDGVNDVRPPHGLDDAQLLDLVDAAVRGAEGGGPSAADVAERMRVAIERVLPIPDRDDDVAVVVVRIVD